MILVDTIEDIRSFVRKAKDERKTIGFVPTMGYLHRGHLSLAVRSAEECDVTIMSVFINEKQFGPGEDLSIYPRDIKRDSELAAQAGVDVLFTPGNDEMYPEGYSTYVDMEGGIAEVLCARSRPAHFRGVCTVVAKMFNITRADVNYFGRKDYQQALIIRKMVRDLDLDTEIKILPTVREADGLAMSSRNIYLSPEERKRAASLNKALLSAEKIIAEGKNDLSEVKRHIEKIISPSENVRIDYIEILDAVTLGNVTEKTREILIAFAVFIGKTRLIDNIIVKVRSR